MKITKETNEKSSKPEIHIVISPDNAGLLQAMALQFAENIANCKAHQSQMRRLAMLIDKVL